MNYKELIEDIDIIEELENRGLNGNVSGNNLMLKCVYHEDSHPSFGIKLKTTFEHGKIKPKGVFHCFGCGSKGNFFHLIAHLEGKTLSEIIKEYKKEEVDVKKLLEMKEFFTNVLQEEKEIKNTIRVLSKDLLLKFKKPFGKYLNYLYKRKINNSSIKKWNILCCSRGKWTGRIVFPIEDTKKRLISLEARKIDEANKLYKTRKLKDTDRKKVLYGLQFIKKGTKVVLVEGPFDAIYLQQFGIPAVAIGTASISHWQIMKLVKFTDRVALSLDGSVPYMTDDNKLSIKREKTKLLRYFEVDVVRLPINKDPNDLSTYEVKKFYSKFKRGLK